MAINRAQLLKTLRENGYKGDETLEAVKSFVEVEHIDLTDDAGNALDVKAAWDNVPRKAVKLESEAKPEIKAGKLDSKFVAAHTGGEGSHGMSAKAVRNSWARKRYDAKAAKGETVFSCADEAEAFAAHMRLSLDRTAKGIEAYSPEQKAADVEIVKALSTTVDGLGGTLVPDQFSNVLIDLIPQYGAAAAVCGITQMDVPKMFIPRWAGDATTAWQGEGSTITDSDPSTDAVQLTATSLKTVTRVSNQWFRTTPLAVADLMAQSMARAQAFRIDRAFFFGNGAATDGNFVGVASAINNLSATKADISSYVVGAGAAFSNITLGNALDVVGRLLDKTDVPDQSYIVCHRAAFFSVFDRLARSAGGATVDLLRNERVVGGIRVSNRNFNGYPVVFSEVFPKTAPATNKIFALVGNFSAAAKIGIVRNSMNFATSDQRYFDTDQTAFRMVQDVAIAVHDFGNADASSANWIQSPVAGLAVS
jgi:HK97 family phage major capsid protein